MKKFVMWMLFLLLIMAHASAYTQKEWDQHCRSKTTAEVTLYQITTNPDGTKEATECSSLPGGLYIVVCGFDYDMNMYQVAYLTGSSPSFAYAHKSSAIVDCCIRVYLNDGTVMDLPEAVVNDPEALKKKVDAFGHGIATIPPFMTPLPYVTSPQTWDETPAPTPNATNKPSYNVLAVKAVPVSLTAADSERRTVTIVELGMHTCTVQLDGNTFVLPTVDLTFAQNVPEENKIAVIHAPRTGKCTLRSTASSNGKALKQCKAGMLAAVLEYGPEYCKIHDGSETGYVQTSCLMFYDNANEPTEGMLTYNGKGTGKTTINIRCTADKGSAKVAEWPTGTTVSVFAYEDGWYRIEYNGVHGFVMEEFLTMDE